MREDGDYLRNTPGVFLQDCQDSGIDVGFYDEQPRLWIAGPRHIRNAFERATYYVSKDGPDQCPPGLKVAARALLKRIVRRYGDNPFPGCADEY